MSPGRYGTTVVLVAGEVMVVEGASVVVVSGTGQSSPVYPAAPAGIVHECT